MTEDGNGSPLNGKNGGIIRIDSYRGLLAFAARVNGGEGGARAVLTADIAAADGNWTPIGADPDHPFTGRFDGRGYAITGLSNEDAEKQTYAGLFGCVLGGSVWNADVRDGRIRGAIAGGVAAVCGGELVNSGFGGEVQGSLAAGGVAGRLEKTGVLGNCRFQGGVKSDSAAGGFAGQAGGAVRGCRGSGDVSGGLTAGGVAGCVREEGAAEDCSFLGTVTGGHAAGGAAGENRGRVTVCRFFGSVEGKLAGGLAGDNDGELSGCESGDRVAGAAAGGAVGANGAGGTVRACRFSGSVEGSSVCGAVAGENAGRLQDCESSISFVGGSGGVRGVVGRDRGGSARNCGFRAVPYGAPSD